MRKKGKNHDGIISVLSRLLKGEIVDTNIGGRTGIDLITENSNVRTGIEVKPLPFSWQKQLEIYKEKQNLQKVVLVVDVPEVVDEVFVFRRKQMATAAKNVIVMFQNLTNHWLETLKLIKEDLNNLCSGAEKY